jgi:hypothetical protein
MGIAHMLMFPTGIITGIGIADTGTTEIVRLGVWRRKSKGFPSSALGRRQQQRALLTGTF